MWSRCPWNRRRCATPCRATRTISCYAVEHDIQRPNAAAELLDVGHARRQDYRVNVKRESNGIVSSYLHDRVQANDVLQVSAPRGGFTLRSGDTPVVLLSAGIGALRYSPCCIHCPPWRQFVLSGGSTERVTEQSTHLPRSPVNSCKRSRTDEATLSTVSPIQRINQALTTTLLDTWTRNYLIGWILLAMQISTRAGRHHSSNN
jgi:hypothetical protein